MPRRTPPAPTRRPFRALPPITRGPEPVEGITVLDEVQGDAGVVLWQSLRNVLLWARAAPEQRAALFDAGAAAARARVLADLGRDGVEVPADALAAAAGVLADPQGADAESIARACDELSRWAEEKPAPGTALAFAQAAALAQPGDAARACAVGRLARRNGEAVRAEGWLHLAVVLARGSGDWSSYARAFLGLGNLAVQRGNLPRARRLHRQALKAARRHRLRTVEAQALHDLFVTAAETGSDEEAREAAAGALRAYGRTHPRLAVLAADVACFWVARGSFRRALPVLWAAAARLEDPAERVVVLANAARAAGGAGDREGYERAAAAVRRLLASGQVEAAAAQAWLNLSRGAGSLGDAATSAGAARQAAALAAERGQAKIGASAEALLAAARRGLSPAAAPYETSRDAAAALLAGELVRCLSADV